MSNQRKEFYIPTLSDDKKELEKENDQASSMTSKEAKEENIKNAPDVFVSPFLGPQANRVADTSQNSTTGRKRYDDYRDQTNREYGLTKESYYQDDRVMTTEDYLEILDNGTPKRTASKSVGKWEDIKQTAPKNIDDGMAVPNFEREQRKEEQYVPVNDKRDLDESFKIVVGANDETLNKTKVPTEVKEEVIYEKEVEVGEREKPQNKTIIKTDAPKRKGTKYVFPPLSILSSETFKNNQKNTWADEQSAIINQTFEEFNYAAKVAGYICGPSVTQFLISVASGTKVSNIRNFERDLLLKLSARSIRIQDPIPGKSYAGIEIPNQERKMVPLGNLINNRKFLDDNRKLLVALGLDITGDEEYVDIAKMPHGLIAGATGSGKSVCINSLIISLLYKNTPEELKLILIDPKMVELSCYDGIPHLAMPVITEPRKAAAALNWATLEMDRRFDVFKTFHARNIQSYNENVLENGGQIMPYIVVIIDELADLMAVASSEIETSIQRLTQKARAAGIHLIVATQRPSTDVIKGTIKNNIPVRIAFRLSSYSDSGTVIDHGGAEKLLGNGDMLYVDDFGERRIQGTYVKDMEIMKITNFLSERYAVNYLVEESDLEEKAIINKFDDDQDEIFEEVARYVVKYNVGSNNRITQEFNISFNRANRLLMKMESLGIVSSTVKGKQREVLVTETELEDILNNL